jgi:hypothetical protein
MTYHIRHMRITSMPKGICVQGSQSLRPLIRGQIRSEARVTGCEPTLLSANKMELTEYMYTEIVNDSRKYYFSRRKRIPSPTLEGSHPQPCKRSPYRGPLDA